MRLATCHLAAAALFAALLPLDAHADDPSPAPDKSGFDLFNPTSGAKMRSLSTDRPDKSATPYTVDAGHFQYETDLVGILYDGYTTTHSTTRQFFTADPVFKVGVTNYADVEVALGGYLTERVMDRSTGTSQNTDGYGDVTLRAKFNLIGNDGGPVALSVAPYFKAPTATTGLGNGVGEFGVVAPAAFNLPFNITLLVVTEFDDFKNVNNTGRHAGFTNSIDFERLVAPKLTIELELWSQVQTSGVPAQYTFDLAFAYLLSPTTQLDTAAYVGLNKAAPDIIGYVGLSQRF